MPKHKTINMSKIISTNIFLQAMLIEGPEPASLIFSRGKEFGFSKSQLKTTKKTMGIKSFPERDSKNKIVKWWWG